MDKQLLYQIALTSLPYIGDKNAKKLVAYCGGAEEVFKQKKTVLEKIPGIGQFFAATVHQNKKAALLTAEKEIKFIIDNDISTYFYVDENYPNRLKHCEDGPILLYTKGNVNFNFQKVISIVGTRNATDYGRDFCEQIVKDLKPHYPLIISGLAYGIDICAHKAALKNNISTVGVVAHGLDRIYPAFHQSIAKNMEENGGIITEFKNGTPPDRENFPKRNRIVAGMADLTIVIESKKKGGSLITAGLANDYNRDVFALPGRVNDLNSEGCNWLIKSHRAALIQSVADIEYIMNWQSNNLPKAIQTNLFEALTNEQKIIADVLSEKGKAAIDDIALLAKMPMSKTTSLLLDLEFSGRVKSLPGKVYKLV